MTDTKHTAAQPLDLDKLGEICDNWKSGSVSGQEAMLSMAALIAQARAARLEADPVMDAMCNPAWGAPDLYARLIAFCREELPLAQQQGKVKEWVDAVVSAAPFEAEKFGYEDCAARLDTTASDPQEPIRTYTFDADKGLTEIQAQDAADTTASASGDVRAAFEAWANSHGGLSLDRAGDQLKTDDGLLHFPTYKFGRTEIAWRAWANRRAAQPVQTGVAVDERAFEAWLNRHIGSCNAPKFLAHAGMGDEYDKALKEYRAKWRATLAPVAAQQAAAKAPAAQAVDAVNQLQFDQVRAELRQLEHCMDACEPEDQKAFYNIRAFVIAAIHGAASPASTPEASQQADEEKLRALLESEFDCYRTTAGLIPWAINALLDNSPHRIAPQQAAAVAAPSDELRKTMKPRALTHSLDDYWQAPSGVGPLAAAYKNKPHRLLYDLIAALLAAPTAGAATTSEDARNADVGRVLDGLRSVMCAVGIVGQIDGHDVIRRNSVLDLIDRSIAAMRATQQEGE